MSSNAALLAYQTSTCEKNTNVLISLEQDIQCLDMFGALSWNHTCLIITNIMQPFMDQLGECFLLGGVAA